MCARTGSTRKSVGPRQPQFPREGVSGIRGDTNRPAGDVWLAAGARPARPPVRRRFGRSAPEVTLEDVAPPTVSTMVDTPLTRGEWTNGRQPVNYQSGDSVGVRSVEAIIGGASAETAQRPCQFANARATFAVPLPCPNGPGQITVDTGRFAEGTQTVAVQAQDPAGNAGEVRSADCPHGPNASQPASTSPSKAGTAVAQPERLGGRTTRTKATAHRSSRAVQKLCPAAGGDCARTEHVCSRASGRDCHTRPGPGSLDRVVAWRRDAAGNEAESMASVPVTLRYDPDAPQLGFEPSSPSDPTLVTVKATDAVSGVASRRHRDQRRGLRCVADAGRCSARAIS